MRVKRVRRITGTSSAAFSSFTEASGEAASGDSTVAGFGLLDWLASGDVAASDSAIAGIGLSDWISRGDLAASDCVIAGEGISAAEASGDLAAGESALAGFAIGASIGQGQLSPGDAIVTAHAQTSHRPTRHIARVPPEDQEADVPSDRDPSRVARTVGSSRVARAPPDVQ